MLDSWLYDRSRNRSREVSVVSDSPFLWVGEQRALDFLNTEPIERGERKELLVDFERLVAWCEQARFVSSHVARDALARWGTSHDGEQTLALAHRLRRDLRRLLEQRATGKASGTSLRSLNACLRLGGTYTQVVSTASGSRFERREQVALSEPMQLLWPIAKAAAELLCDLDLELVRRCDNPQCVLYFRDVSKNHARRWCSMALCGNRMKVAAHEERKRAQRMGSRR